MNPVDPDIVAKCRADWNAPRRHLALKFEPDGKWADVMARSVKLMGTGTTIAMVGSRGSGKTQLAVELMRHVTAHGRLALYRTAAEILMMLRAAPRRGSEKSEVDIIADHADPHLLVIDEFSRRGETDWENNMLFELINRRYNAMRDTVLICNLDVEAFCKMAGDSLVSRINESGEIVNCNWPTFRQ